MKAPLLPFTAICHTARNSVNPRPISLRRTHAPCASPRKQDLHHKSNFVQWIYGSRARQWRRWCVQVLADIVQPVADAMVAEGAPFRGVLFAGLMIDGGVAQALEFNVRFGDPEVQCLMMRLRSDLLPTLRAAARGDLAAAGDTARTLEWRAEAALGVVMASEGYPGTYEKGTVIRGLDAVDARDGVKVFHAGTADVEDGKGVVAAGGRVLCVTALGVDVVGAQRAAYEGVREVDWPEGFYRNDIGWRAVGRQDPA